MLALPPRKREISPAVNASVEEFLKRVASSTREIIDAIRDQKAANNRPLPSAALVDSSSLLTQPHRIALLDSIATLVDENLSGRSDMCQQFADLLYRALTHLNCPARPVVGIAMYFSPAGDEVFRWKHAWVRVREEVIDGNTDCLFENPRFPKAVTAAPYWGNIKEIPGRRLREERGTAFPVDTDVSNTWWPDLKEWLDRESVKV